MTTVRQRTRVFAGILLASGMHMLLPPAVLQAQVESPPVPLDSRVRVTTTSSPDMALVGSLEAWDGRALELRYPDTMGQTIPLPEVVRIEVSRGMRGNATTGVLVGGGLGVALGIASSIVIGTSSGDSWIAPSFGSYVGITAVFGLTGAGLGAIIGALIKTEEWEDVPLPATTRQGPAAVVRR